MSKEIALQQEMFSGQWVDNRSTAQRKADREQNGLYQKEMFSARETVQYGTNARPWLKALPRPLLTLEIQDVRTGEERERDLERAAQALTRPMFAEAETPKQEPISSEARPTLTTTERRFPPNGQGYRVWSRKEQIYLRSRKVKCRA